MISDDNSVGSSRLDLQIEELISQNSTWVEICDEIDVSSYKRRDGYPDYHDSAPFRPMFLAYLWSTTEKISLSAIPNELEDKPELATAMGFDVENLPSQSTCKPCRLVNRRFEDLQSLVESAAEEIRNLAAERGSPIGFDLSVTDGEDEKEQSLTKRQEQRLLRKKGKEVLDELKSVAIPSITLPRSPESVYEDDELLVLEAIAAIGGKAANDAGSDLGDMKNPDPNIDDPFYDDGPSGETLLEAIKMMSVGDIADVLNFALRKIYTRAKPTLQRLENEDGTRFCTNARVALDTTYVAYRGDRDELVWVQGAPDDKEYDWCHKFGTAAIVGENVHFIIGVTPLGSLDYADTEAYADDGKSHYMGDITRRLLNIANEYVDIRRVYADRGFYAADTLYVLKNRQLKYVIPAKKDDRIRPLCNDFDNLKRGYNDDNDTPLYVQQGYAIRGRVKHQVSNTRIETNLVILPPDESDPVHSGDSPQPFATNLKVGDEIALDRRWSRKEIEQYSDRGAIENSYSSVKECAANTTSKEFEIRWFHFAFGCLVYNMWLLLDFLTQARIGVIETRTKPRITLSRFRKWLEMVLDTLI